MFSQYYFPGYEIREIRESNLFRLYQTFVPKIYICFKIFNILHL